MMTMMMMMMMNITNHTVGRETSRTSKYNTAPEQQNITTQKHATVSCCVKAKKKAFQCVYCNVTLVQTGLYLDKEAASYRQILYDLNSGSFTEREHFKAVTNIFVLVKKSWTSRHLRAAYTVTHVRASDTSVVQRSATTRFQWCLHVSGTPCHLPFFVQLRHSHRSGSS